ncbi:hypothetical protein ES703_52182 [subsurface metagenome]
MIPPIKIELNFKKHVKHCIEHIEKLLRHVNLKENQNDLEVGCGNGHLCKHLARKYHYYKKMGIKIDRRV